MSGSHCNGLCVAPAVPSHPSVEQSDLVWSQDRVINYILRVCIHSKAEWQADRQTDIQVHKKRQRDGRETEIETLK